VTAQAAASPVRVRRDYLGAWCGSVMLGASVLVPVLGWLAPLGFAALLGLMGLLMLPALRVTDEDRPVLVVLLGALLWAAVSSTASPYHPKRIEQNLARISGTIADSVPPARIASAWPRLTTSAASPIACVPLAHADTIA